ncbi:hypothetical protein ACFVZH_36610 [Streptomyces sp. NPDC059534]|uniref:hypothetical protein n=1 Tax=Streptomyces sp. NPDC059534 TaxID=3346859 RepID=UPI003694F72E
MSKPSIGDRLGIALHNTGVRVAGAKGAKAAAAVSDALIGRHLELCDEKCGNCGGTEVLHSDR